MKKIISYQFSPKDMPNITSSSPGKPFSVEIIKNAKILSVQGIFDKRPENSRYPIQMMGRIWLLVDAGETKIETRTFVLNIASYPFDDKNLVYIGTYQVFMGTDVLHLFEIVASN